MGRALTLIVHLVGVEEPLWLLPPPPLQLAKLELETCATHHTFFSLPFGAVLFSHSKPVGRGKPEREKERKGKWNLETVVPHPPHATAEHKDGLTLEIKKNKPFCIVLRKLCWMPSEMHHL